MIRKFAARHGLFYGLITIPDLGIGSFVNEGTGDRQGAAGSRVLPWQSATANTTARSRRKAPPGMHPFQRPSECPDPQISEFFW